MDKVLFCGECEVKGLERVGVGLRLEEGKGEGEWVTDHYRLMAEIVVVGEVD